jgi:DNA-binding IclR family transcriptional regulator
MATRVGGATRFSHVTIPSVDRAVDLLNLLASTSTGLNLSTISRRLNIPKSSAYYLVTTLAKRNCVRRKPDGRVYLLGTDVPGFAKASSAESDLKVVCLPHLEALSRRFGMPAQVGIRENAEARIIDRTAMPGLKLDSWVGRHFDLHCTAIGKALISHLAHSELETLLRIRGLPRHNENTICSLEALESHLAETRRRGFATDNEEHELGVRCVASPIFNSVGGTVGAIGVFASSDRLPHSEMSSIGFELTRVAREICRSLSG